MVSSDVASGEISTARLKLQVAKLNRDFSGTTPGGRVNTGISFSWGGYTRHSAIDGDDVVFCITKGVDREKRLNVIVKNLNG